MAQFNSGYTSSEIMAMQRDAEKRVREMQKRSEEKIKSSNITFDLPKNPVKNMLKSMDKDRLILLCLFLLLIEEESDPMLLLALAYIFF